MTLQVAPRYDVDGFELGDLGVWQYVLAGGAAVGTAIAAWLATPSWSPGAYNTWMKTMNDTITAWNTAGGANGCWAKNPAMRTDWLAFWKRFSDHYAKYGQQSGYVAQSAEDGARILMQQLVAWGDLLNKTCGLKTNATALNPSPSSGVPDDPNAPQDWGTTIKWAAFGIGGLVLLNLISGVRGAFPAHR